MKLKDLSIKYDFKSVELNKYQEWLSSDTFKSGNINKKPYTIVIPPPNVTGKLHLGHAIDTTIQDIIIRRKRMQGFDTLYLPGMDHAGIATQVKVETMLKEQGISRYDLGREKFLEVAWKWKENYASIIRKQWEVIGLSLDYSKERFTLDEGLNKAVNTVFIKMYNDGLIYRGWRITNWDVVSKTAISNIEVEYKNISGAYYYIKYPFVENEEDGLIITTTRPETMFGDTALMVHPSDSRYAKYVGKEVYIPTTKVKIKVIADEYVDMRFGTGVVKVTPAHDPNDFEVGLRHKLKQVICMNIDGTMNENAFLYQNLDRFECRKNLINDLKKLGLCIKIKKMSHSVGHSERTGVVVEPRLSLQWFVKMESLANEIILMQKTNSKVKFYPARFEKIFINWLNNIQDWCISRQLWWGHRIPAWYKDDEIYVGENPPKDYVQDEDVLDTWFSSALWPFSTLGWPDNTFDLNRYFPTDTLVTGYDIIFFWVARMIFQSKYFLNDKPFNHVVIHGIIRDETGRKISKSLNNGVDMVQACNIAGADALRYFLTTTSTLGLDIKYSEEKILAAWNYINKIWNISRFIGLNYESNNYNNEEIEIKKLTIIDKWILSKLNDVIKQADRYYEKYEFAECAKIIYNFVWNDLASWYLELVKVNLSHNSINICSILNYILKSILKLLHPIIPFVTDNIYKSFNDSSITNSSWPLVNKNHYFNDINFISILFELITYVRVIRAEYKLGNKVPLTLYINVESDLIKQFIIDYKEYFKKFVNCDKFIFNQLNNYQGYKVQVLNTMTIAIPFDKLVNVEDEKNRLNSLISNLEKEILRSNTMLNNKNFLDKAPETKVKEEKEKLEKYLKQFDEAKNVLKSYN